MLSATLNILIKKIEKDLGSEKINTKELLGGLVHHVYLLKINDKKSFVLKIRGNHFKENADIAVNPDEASFEADVLKSLRIINIKNFPELIRFYPSEAALLMENIGLPNSNLLELLGDNSLKTNDYYRLARLISELLININQHGLKINNPKLKNNLNDNLAYRINRYKLPYLTKVIKKIGKAKKYFIIGDLSPKNIFNGKNKIRICDLEFFQKAPLELDVYFLLAHIILHNLCEKNLIKIIKNFQEGLAPIREKLQLTTDEINKYILATMIYRLDNEVIKYEFANLSNTQRIMLLHRIYFLLSEDRIFGSLEQLMDLLVNKSKDEKDEIEAKILEVDKDEIIDCLIKNNSSQVFNDVTTITTFETPFSPPRPFLDKHLNEMIEHLKIVTDNFTKSLDDTGAYLRIRQQGENREFTLKYKTGKNDSNYKIEKEINVPIDNQEFQQRIEQWLTDNKFATVSNEIKHRISFINRLYGTQIDIDSWQKPFIPTYIEIEGFNQKTIDLTAEMLGFEKKDLSSVPGKELFKKYKVKRGI